MEENSESYIPTTIRDALESAGINIDEIISMKNQLEMTLGSSINLSSSPAKSGKIHQSQHKTENVSNGATRAEETLTAETVSRKTSPPDEQQRASSSININTLSSASGVSKSNQLVSVSSNLKSIDIKQNMSAKVSEQVENANVAAAVAAAAAAATARRTNGRKKSAGSQNRYATVPSQIFQLSNSNSLLFSSLFFC